MPLRHFTYRHLLKTTLGLAIALVFSSAAVASNSGVTYQGRILKPDGSALSGANVQFKLQIRTPDSAACLMYEELQSRDMRNSNGSFSLTINDGTGSRTDSTSLGLDRIFANRGSYTFDPSTCSSGSSYAPNPDDGRSLVVLFKDETMATWEPIPAQKINFVPFAFESKQIAGWTADSLLRVVAAGGDPLTGLAPLSNAQYTALMALVNGTSSTYAAAGTLAGASVPATSSLTTGQALTWNGSAWVATSVPGGAGSVTSTMLASGAVGSGAIAAGAVGTSAIAGNVSVNTSGTLGAAVVTARDFKIYPAGTGTGYVEMLAPAAIPDGTHYTVTWPLNAGAAGQVLTTDGSGVLTWAAASAPTQWTTHGSNISYDGGGNVGIGTTSPMNALTVNGSIGVGAYGNIGGGLAYGCTGCSSSNWITMYNGSSGSMDLNASGVGSQAFNFYIGGTLKDVISATGNVGIGTTSPTNALSVAGDASISGKFSVGGGVMSGTRAIVLGGGATASGPDSIALQKGTASGQYSTAAGYNTTASGTQSLAMIEGSTATAQDAVAIGSYNAASGIYSVALGNHTSAPAYSQTVIGAYNTTSGSESSSSWVSTDPLFSIGNGVVGTPSTALTVLKNGNVGIGTTAPTAVLHLKAGTATASTAPLKFTSGTVLSTPEDGAMEYASSNLYYTIGSTRYVIPLNTASGNFSNVATIGNTSGSITMTPMSGNSVIINAATVSTSPTTGALIVSGGAGISGAVNTSGNVTSGGVFLAANGTASAPAFTFSTQSNNGMFTPAINSVGFSTNSVERVRIGAAGNVGIGTTSPGRQLDVLNTVRAFNPVSNATMEIGRAGDAIYYNEFDIWSGYNATAPTWKMSQDYAGAILTANHSTMRFNVGTTAAEVMRLTGTGNVGIGTTSPVSPLHINISGSAGTGYSTSSGDAVVINNSGGAGNWARMYLLGGTGSSGVSTFYMGNKDNTQGAGLSTNYGSDLSLMANGSGRVYINSTGNVGVGTGNPSSRLTVVGPSGAGYPMSVQAAPGTGPGAYMNLALNNTSSGAYKSAVEFQNNGSGKFSFGVDYLGAGSNNFSLFDNVAGAIRMWIDPSGNVGIGTTAPASTLAVNGAITSTAVSNGSTTIDFASGNLQYTSSSCGALTLKNLKSGGTYQLAVQGSSGGTCTFTAYSDSGSTTVTVKTGAINTTQTAGSHILFSFSVMGSFAYATSVDGY